MCLNIFKYFKINIYPVKNFNMSLLAPSIWHNDQKYLIQFRLTNLPLSFNPGRTANYLFISIIRSVYSLNFNLCTLPILRHIARFWLENEFTGVNYTPKPKTTLFKCSIVLFTTWTHNVSNWHSACPHNRFHRYWGFALDASVPNDLSAISKYCTNNNNSSSLSLSNKVI